MPRSKSKFLALQEEAINDNDDDGESGDNNLYDNESNVSNKLVLNHLDPQVMDKLKQVERKIYMSAGGNCPENSFN